MTDSGQGLSFFIFERRWFVFLFIPTLWVNHRTFHDIIPPFFRLSAVSFTQGSVYISSVCVTSAEQDKVTQRKMGGMICSGYVLGKHCVNVILWRKSDYADNVKSLRIAYLQTTCRLPAYALILTHWNNHLYTGILCVSHLYKTVSCTTEKAFPARGKAFIACS